MPESKKRNNLTVALIQMQSGIDVKANYDQALSFLNQAKDNYSSELIVLPENFLCIGCENYSDKLLELEFYTNKLCEWAEVNAIALVLGSIPFASDALGKCYSRSMLINTDGSVVGTYDKCHLFDVIINDQTKQYRESDKFVAGTAVSVFPVLGHKVGLSVCYDLRFPELYQQLQKQGADMLTVPSAFTFKTGEAHWEVLLRARAIETQCFVLAANQCGSHEVENQSVSRQTWGHSMIVDPWGKVLAQLGAEPGICSAELDFETLKQVRQSMDLMSQKRF